jgi:hypothetical protein
MRKEETAELCVSTCTFLAYTAAPLSTPVASAFILTESVSSRAIAGAMDPSLTCREKNGTICRASRAHHKPEVHRGSTVRMRDAGPRRTPKQEIRRRN